MVLVTPQIHWNTGNVGRTCLGAGARLHLIRPLGFSLDDRSVRRAGLDYWPQVDLTVWDSLATFEARMAPAAGEMALLTKTAARVHWEMPFVPRLFLLFGSETDGLPRALLQRFPDNQYRIPISGAIRSLNLSTAVGIALYETLRPRHER